MLLFYVCIIRSIFLIRWKELRSSANDICRYLRNVIYYLYIVISL